MALSVPALHPTGGTRAPGSVTGDQGLPTGAPGVRTVGRSVPTRFRGRLTVGREVDTEG